VDEKARLGMKNIGFPALLLFFGLGICPLLAGTAFFWASGQSSVVTCTRLETIHVNCHIARAFLGLIPTEEWTVSRVTGTEMTTNCEDNSCTYAVNLLTNNDVVPLTNMATSELESVEVEQARIDNFLNNSEAKSIEYSSGPTWIGMLLSLPFIALGGFVTIRGVRIFFAHRNI
jgi:hypothetical protein